MTPVWDFSCPDWIDRLKNGRPLMPILPLDMERAAKAVAIFDKLRLPDVPGQPLFKDGIGEWQRDWVRAIFGGYDRDGLRRIRELFCLVAKKNNKTTGSAGIMLTALLMNDRPRADFLLIGPTQEIADGAFQQAVGIIEADEEGYLQTRFHVQEHLKAIIDRRNKSKLKIKTFDTKVMTGSRPVGILVDEEHVLGTMDAASRVMQQVRGGMIANPESFLIIITTQSDQAPAGVFKADLQYARAVRDGRIRDGVEMLPLLYEFSEEQQTSPEKPWADPALWPQVLPNIGRTIDVDRLLKLQAQEREKGDEFERIFASQHLNVQIGLALHSDRWRGADYWLDAALPGLTLDELLDRSEVVTIGLDGGGLDDLFGMAVIGRHKTTKEWLLWNKAWAHDDVLKRRKEISERLLDFQKDGDLVVCEDATQDVREIADLCEKIHATGKLPEKNAIGVDPIEISALVDELSARNLGGDRITAIRQGFAHSPAIWGMERKLKDGTLWHAGQALMAWVVGNAKTEQRGNAVLVTKQAAGKAKIDPLVAAYNAFMLMALNPVGAQQMEPSLAFL